MTNKERLIEIANKYYSGQSTGLTDKEYDELEDLVKTEDPNFNVKDHIVYADGLIKCRHLYPFMQIRKTRHNVHDNLRDQVKSSNAIAVPKYDGSSIRAYYCDGKLTNIISRSNEWEGVNQTNKLRNKVITEVPNWVKYIDYELLTSIDDFGDNARQKSNGLVNSKYLDDEVEKYALAAPFYVNEHEGKSYLERMNEACQGLLVRFDLDELSDFHIDRVKINGKMYPIDGIVVYDDTESDCLNKIFKFYSLEAVTTIIDHVEWNRSNFGYYIPKVILNPITISGKWVKQVAAGSADVLYSDHLCKGAEVEVVMAGLTIPQINRVLSYPNVEDYNEPKCWDCGSEMTRTSKGYRCDCVTCSYNFNKVFQGFMWNIYSEPEFNNIVNEGVHSVDEYISFLRRSDEFLEITRDHLKDICNDSKLGQVILNSLNISGLRGSTKQKILNNLPKKPTIDEIRSPFGWCISWNAQQEIKVKLEIIIEIISKLNELLVEKYNLEIISKE